MRVENGPLHEVRHNWGPLVIEWAPRVALVAVATVAVIEALRSGWVPVGDDAVLVTRARDVFGPNAPLLGMPTSLGQFTGQMSYHPGPLFFVWMAPFVHLFGRIAGGAIGAAAFNVAVIAAAGWAGQRVMGRRGELVGLAGAVFVLIGGAPIYQPLNSAIGPTATFAVLMLAWAVRCGARTAAVPLAVFASIVAQAHLPYAIVVAAVAVPVLSLELWGCARSASREGPRVVARAVLPGLALGALLWAGPLLDGGRNIVHLVEAGMSSDVPSRGFGTALGALMRLLRWPHTRPDLVSVFSGSIEPVSVLLFLCGSTVLIRVWLRGHGRVRQGTLVLGLAAAGVAINTARLPPTPVEPLQVSWFQSVSVFAWILVATAVVTLSVTWWRRRPVEQLHGWPVRVAVGVAGFWFLAAAVLQPAQAVASDRSYDAMALRGTHVLTESLDGRDGDARLAVLSRGSETSEKAAFGAAAARIEDGAPTLLSSNTYWGAHRQIGVEAWPERALLVTTAPAPGSVSESWEPVARVEGVRAGARARLAGDVADLVRGEGSLELTDEGRRRFAELVDGLLPGVCQRVEDWLDDPQRLASEAPVALLELYRWAGVAHPELPAQLARRVADDRGAGLWAYLVPVSADPAALERPDAFVLERLDCGGEGGSPSGGTGAS